jgi:hypothetical protein
VLGQSGSSVLGQSGSGVLGQSGSGVHGQSGSALLARTGSGVRNMTVSSTRRASRDASAVRLSTRSFFESAAMGPVEAVEFSGHSALVTVLGQAYATSHTVAQSVQVGDYVVAAGTASGQLQVLYSVGDQYVPGASPVYAVGAITKGDFSGANVSIGTTLFDYSSHLASEPGFTPVAGQVIEMRGIQPVPRGKVLVGLLGD